MQLWTRGGCGAGGCFECGVSAGTTERHRCQESDVTDEKPALEAEIIAAMVFAGNYRLVQEGTGFPYWTSLCTMHWMTRKNYLPVTSGPNARFRYRCVLILRDCRQAHLGHVRCPTASSSTVPEGLQTTDHHHWRSLDGLGLGLPSWIEIFFHPNPLVSGDLGFDRKKIGRGHRPKEMSNNT